jgi:hypothetical protein
MEDEEPMDFLGIEENEENEENTNDEYNNR